MPEEKCDHPFTLKALTTLEKLYLEMPLRYLTFFIFRFIYDWISNSDWLVQFTVFLFPFYFSTKKSLHLGKKFDKQGQKLSIRTQVKIVVRSFNPGKKTL